MDSLVTPQIAPVEYETDAPVDYRMDGAVTWITMNRPRCIKARYSQVVSGRAGIKAMLASNVGAN